MFVTLPDPEEFRTSRSKLCLAQNSVERAVLNLCLAPQGLERAVLWFYTVRIVLNYRHLDPRRVWQVVSELQSVDRIDIYIYIWVSCDSARREG